MERNHKCYFEIGGNYEPCNGMIRTLELLISPIGVGGVEIVRIFRTNTSPHEYDLGVTAKANKKKELKGVLWNNCPFCKEALNNKDNKLATLTIPYYSVSVPSSSQEPIFCVKHSVRHKTFPKHPTCVSKRQVHEEICDCKEPKGRKGKGD